MIPLLLIRHGTTDWNALGRIQGRTDRPLDASGSAAIRAAVLPPGWASAACYASPLKRAMETAHLLGLRPIPEPGLIEMAWGEWEGQRLSDLRAELGDAMRANEARGLDFRPPGGESPRDVQQRLRPVLKNLAGPAIFVTHKGVLRALYALATGWSMAEKGPDKLRDGTAQAFQVAADGTPEVQRLNIPLERGS